MRIIQLLPTLSYGDAVGNDCMSLNQAIIDMGYQTCIYAENIGENVNKNLVKYVESMPYLDKDDILIYHLSVGSNLNYQIEKYMCKKIIIYHNITPPLFFQPYSREKFSLCKMGLDGVKHLANIADYCLADSYFNKQELISLGYKCKIDVRPILIPFSDYEKKPNKRIISQYNNQKTNILFSGRIAPNKKQEDIIAAFYYYKTNINKNSRLILVGAFEEDDAYAIRLKEYVKRLDLKDVIFTGHVKFDEILAYYKIADIFLCMSEHEGFCVPLVEAMYFNIPIIAYNACAVPDTLGGSGLLIEDKEPEFVAKIIGEIINNIELKKQVIEGQRQRLNDFQYDQVFNIFEKCLIEYMGDIK